MDTYYSSKSDDVEFGGKFIAAKNSKKREL
jgi:hypothetical protein